MAFVEHTKKAIKFYKPAKLNALFVINKNWSIYMLNNQSDRDLLRMSTVIANFNRKGLQIEEDLSILNTSFNQLFALVHDLLREPTLVLIENSTFESMSNQLLRGVEKPSRTLPQAESIKSFVTQCVKRFGRSEHYECLDPPIFKSSHQTQLFTVNSLYCCGNEQPSIVIIEAPSKQISRAA